MATPLTIRTNNPGALRPISPPWKGQTGTTPGAVGSFAVFESPEMGTRAFFVNARTQISRGKNTVEKFIYIYAPPSENLTEIYVSKVAKKLGGRTTPISANNRTQMLALANAIFEMEAGANSGWEKKFTEAVIAKGWELFQGKATGKVFNLGGALLIGAAAVLLYKYFKK